MSNKKIMSLRFATDTEKLAKILAIVKIANQENLQYRIVGNEIIVEIPSYEILTEPKAKLKETDEENK